MSDPVVDFFNRWGLHKAKAAMGNRQSQRVVSTYHALRWAGHKPLDALKTAELECDDSLQVLMQASLDYVREHGRMPRPTTEGAEPR
jgi:hypothetical protein